jgi:hypothetical protein
MEFLQPITRSWMSKIRMAQTYKEAEFQDDADEAMRFFNGPHDFMYSNRYASKSGSMSLGTENSPTPSFRMTVNKVAEMVQLFGPALYHRNPHRTISTRQYPEFPYFLMGNPEDPMVQQQVQGMQQQEQQEQAVKEVMADLLSYYLNYTPNELDLQSHSRQMIDEAIIKGMGVLWAETYSPNGSPYKMAGSFFDSVDNLVVDPDMESIEHATWIARRRVMPKWEVEKKFGLPKDTLKGNLESLNMQAESEASPDYNYYRQRGETNDLLTYWEIYSRMGLGHRMRGNLNIPANNELMDSFGPYVYLAVTDEHPWPLNLPEEVWKTAPYEEAFMRLQWPTPFWADPADPWPFSYLAFHRVPRKVWPMSHVKPGLGELKFLNWAFSFLADKIKNTSRDFIACRKSLSEEMKSSILSGRDLTLLELDKQHGTIQEVVQFLQHPQFNKDIYSVIEAVMGLLEKRLGLNELMYGESSKQLRSAQEAQVKSDQLRIRPDDMATKVEQTMTHASRKEAFCARWHLTAQDVTPVLGAKRAQLWEQLVTNSDVHAVVHELDYRIEAGTIRKPNRDRDVQNAQQAVQVWAPVLQAYAQMTGDFEPINGLSSMWAKANDMDEQILFMQPPPPPEPDTSGQEMAEAEFQQSMQHKQQEHELKMQQEMERHQTKVEQEQDKAGLQGYTSSMSHQQELIQDDERHDQELTQDQQAHLQELLQSRQEGTLDILLKRQLGDLDIKIKQAQVKQAQAKPSKKEPAGNGQT